MKSSEVWLRDYETAKQLADDTLAMIQVLFNGPSPLSYTLRLLVLWALVTFSIYANCHVQCPILILLCQGGFLGSDCALYCARNGISNSHMGVRRPLV